MCFIRYSLKFLLIDLGVAYTNIFRMFNLLLIQVNLFLITPLIAFEIIHNLKSKIKLVEGYDMWPSKMI
jgi:hypothetical protein